MPEAKKEAGFGTLAFIAERAMMYQRFGFREQVMGSKAAEFLSQFCADNLRRARALGREAQERCKGNERALVELAGKLKYINAYLELAHCYGKQISIMSEQMRFREHALLYISIAYAELEAVEYFDPA